MMGARCEICKDQPPTPREQPAPVDLDTLHGPAIRSGLRIPPGLAIKNPVAALNLQHPDPDKEPHPQLVV